MNSRGQVVVEVDKVVRDLSMLHKTIKMAKFYRILIGAASSSPSAHETINQSLDVDRFNEGEEYDKDRVV